MESTSPAAPSVLLPLLRRVPLLMLACAVPGAVTALHTWVYAQAREPGYPLSRALLVQVPQWQYWALATPFILVFTLENRAGGGVRARLELPFQAAMPEALGA